MRAWIGLCAMISAAVIAGVGSLGGCGGGVESAAPAQPSESEPEPEPSPSPEPQPEPTPAPASPTTTITDPDPVVIPLFGIAGCPAPEPSDAPPKVRVGQPTHTTPLPLAIVRRVIRRDRAAFEACYAPTQAHAACRNLRARVELVVDPAGVPIRASTSADEHELEDCTSAAMMKLRFPEPQGGGVVSLKFPLEYRVAPETRD